MSDLTVLRRDPQKVPDTRKEKLRRYDRQEGKGGIGGTGAQLVKYNPQAHDWYTNRRVCIRWFNTDFGLDM